MKNFFGFGTTPEIEIILDGQEKRRTAEIKTEDGKKERHLLYYDGETVSGKVKITMKKPGSKFEHQGIRVDLVGQIEFYYDRGTQYTFQSLYKQLARPGDLLPHQVYDFEFLKVEKLFESYTGTNCKLRYFIRVTIAKRLTDIIKDREFIVHTLSQYPDMNSSIKMEVGIEDCLHIEFEYNRSKYHLKDVIVGKIYFLLVRIKIKHMELAIIKRETTGAGPNTFNENETIAKFEIMDGAPVKGESIPIRVFLAGYDLTPTFRDVNRKFSVRYYLNLVLVDEEDRRYFKQQEIILWRKIDKPRKTFQATLQQQYKEMQNPNVQFSSSDPIPGSSTSFSITDGGGHASTENQDGISNGSGGSNEKRSESENNGNFERVETSGAAMLEDVVQEDLSESDVKAANGNYYPNYYSSETKVDVPEKLRQERNANVRSNHGDEGLGNSPAEKTTARTSEPLYVTHDELATDAAAMMDAVALDGEERDEE